MRLAVAGLARVPALPRVGRALGEDVGVAGPVRIGERGEKRGRPVGDVERGEQVAEGRDPDPAGRGEQVGPVPQRTARIG